MPTVSGFSVDIIVDGYEAKIINKDGAYYVPVNNGSHYKIRVSNFHNKRCDAIISVDGEDIGTFRLRSYQVASIERPGDTDKKFTFYREDSTIAQISGVEEGKEQNGLISVRFIPERSRKIYVQTIGPEYQSKGFRLGSPSGLPQAPSGLLTSAAPASSYQGNQSTYLKSSSQPVSMAMPMASEQKYSSGATVLKGKSYQEFGIADDMDLDYSKEVIIMVRLVIKESMKYPKRIDYTQ